MKRKNVKCKIKKILAIIALLISLSVGVGAEEGNKVWETFSAVQDGLPSDNVYSLAVDALNNLWIGTDKGVARYDGENWKVYSLEAQFVFAILADTDETWFGSDSGLFVLKSNSMTHYNRSQGNLPSDLVRAILKDGEGNIWVGTDKGLAIFNGRAWVTLHKDNSPLPNNVINDLTRGEDGRVWVATDGGAAVFQEGRWTVYLSRESGLPSDYVHSIAVDEESGQVWFGTSGGLSRFREKSLFRKWITLTPDNGKLLSFNIYALVVDREGRLWIGTDSGLNWMDDKGKLGTYIPGRGADNVSAMATDKDGDLWLRTNEGLGRLSVDNVLR